MAVLAVALAVLAAVRSSSALHPPLPRGQAVTAAMRDPGVATFLRENRYTATHVIALDREHWRVTFTDGPRTILDAAVGPAGKVDATEAHQAGLHVRGSPTAWSPALVIGFTVLFALALGTRPLRSLRNLDAALIAGGFSLSAVLLDQRLVAAQVWVGAATLAYVALRCGQAGLGRPAPAVTAVLERPPLVRPTALVAGALALAGALITVTSTGASDVAFANLAGATHLNHGVMPYGNLTSDVVHGDTYPLLSYVLFMPVAAISPVRDSFDSLDPALWLNAAALLAAAALMARLGGRAWAIAWLAFPPVLLAASAGGNDVPAALLVCAGLAAVGRPLWSAAFLALAGWVKIVPAAALVPAIARAPRPGRALAVVVALCAAGVVVVATGSLSDAWDAMRFQFERGSWFSIWQQTGTRGLQPVFQAGVVALAAVAALEVRRRRPGEMDLQRTAALGGCLVALLQLSANYWTFTYVPWLLPFILAGLFPRAPRRSPQPAPSAP